VLRRQFAEVVLEADPAALSVARADADGGARAVGELSSAGLRVAEFSLGQPSLDEVFLALTGAPAVPQQSSPSLEEQQA
jgi:ABC-2 type transport system ATP-binding protein